MKTNLFPSHYLKAHDVRKKIEPKKWGPLSAVLQHWARNDNLIKGLDRAANNISLT